jgi:hypothetical protein
MMSYLIPRFILATLAAALLHPNIASAQEFLPPDEAARRGGFFVGLEGFTARMGLDVTDANQAVMGFGLDLGDIGSNRFRFRTIGEIGFGSGVDTYVVGADVVYRFTPDSEVAVPYVAVGPGVFTAENCTAFVDCPKVWFQFSLGFELRVRSNMNWLVEYRAQDGFGRHRIFVGLTTRRGS